MNARITEGKLTFDFNDVVNAVKLDDQRHSCRKHYCGTADFFVERDNDILIIEIKDPLASGTPDDNSPFITAEKMHNKLVFSVAFSAVEGLLPPYKRRLFVLLVTDLNEVALLTKRDQIINKLVHRGCVSGQRLCEDVIVINEKKWHQYFPDYRLTRRSP